MLSIHQNQENPLLEFAKIPGVSVLTLKSKDSYIPKSEGIVPLQEDDLNIFFIVILTD